MKSTFIQRMACLSLAILFPAAKPLYAGEAKKIWVDPVLAEKEDPDFLLQGEYLSREGEIYGAQIVALGGGKFDTYLYQGGLPGKGWESKDKKLKFSGQVKAGELIGKSDSGQIKIVFEKNFVILQNYEGKKFTLFRIVRTSPTLGAKAPAGAVTLFDGTSADQWVNGKIENGLLSANGTASMQTFGSYQLHVEFRTPYKPEARGQGRGNSGIYHSGRWETQILDSFGLNPQQNECGGIYSIATPLLNMCLPPLAWQTYDVEFAAAKFDSSGNRSSWPRITVRLNGVVIHDDVELAKDFTPSAPLSSPLISDRGPVYLQDHQNPVMFQNIWILEK